MHGLRQQRVLKDDEDRGHEGEDDKDDIDDIDCNNYSIEDNYRAQLKDLYLSPVVGMVGIGDEEYGRK